MSGTFPEVDWWCDHCNSYLNAQNGFDDSIGTWVCEVCGYENEISASNILYPYDDYSDILRARGGDSGTKVLKYRVLFEGNLEEEVFDTEEDAEEYARYLCSCSRTGAEILNMSNPGDYPYDEESFEEPEYEILVAEFEE